jgi:hypothetical protein
MLSVKTSFYGSTDKAKYVDVGQIKHISSNYETLITAFVIKILDVEVAINYSMSRDIRIYI